MTEQTTLRTVADLPPSGDALRFRREPGLYVAHDGDTRYTIQRGYLSGWVVEYQRDGAGPERWYGAYKTLSGSRLSAEMHRIKAGADVASTDIRSGRCSTPIRSDIRTTSL